MKLKYFQSIIVSPIFVNDIIIDYTLHRSSVVSSITDLQTLSTFGTQTLSKTVFVVGEQSLWRYKDNVRYFIATGRYFMTYKQNHD